MTNLSLEETRALASLATSIGYHVLLEKVVKLRRKESLERLRTVSGQEAIVEAALEFRTWDDVLVTLQTTPTNAIEELKTEGDAIYG